MRKVTISSSDGTPSDQILFVIEDASVSREKMRYVDVISNLESIDEEIAILEAKKADLLDIKAQMDKIMPKKKK